MLRIENSVAQDEKIIVLQPVVVLERVNIFKNSTQVVKDSLPVTPPKSNEGVRQNEKNIALGPSHLSDAYMKRSPPKSPSLNTTRSMPLKCKESDRQIPRSHCSDERPYKCVLCGERFHTNTLLAVHKRIHDKESDAEDSDIDIGSEFDPLPVKSCDQIVSVKSNLPPVPSKNGRNSITRYYSHATIMQDTSSSNDDEIINSSISSQNPAKPSIKKRTRRRTEPINLLPCHECPALFSKQWYLDLHLILLHYNNKDTSLSCPGCTSSFGKENHLRRHVEINHKIDLDIMCNELSSALGLTTDALTGEHIKTVKRKIVLPQQTSPVTSDPSSVKKNVIYEAFDRDWRRATPAAQNHMIDVIESELHDTLIERIKMGDHFSVLDVQRLSRQICDFLKISNMSGSFPSRAWSLRLLSKVPQVPRPGRFRFVHNVNSNYLNAVMYLSNHGLTENKIFYALEARLCDTTADGIVKKVIKTPVGSTSPVASIENTVCTILCSNANGSVLLNPTMIFRGQMVGTEDLHKVKPLRSSYASRDFVEYDFFYEWFAQFLLTIPPGRPILLLIEGQVSQLSFSIIMLARENNVHILFVPSRKRFVHSHQLIRESVLVPLVESFDSEVVQHLQTSQMTSLHVKDFAKVFHPAWRKAVPEIIKGIRQRFVQSGFLPIPQSTKPLEVAARNFLNDVTTDKLVSSVNSDLSGDSWELPTHSPSAGVQAPPTPTRSTLDAPASTPLPCVEVKQEPVDYDSSVENPSLSPIKEEPVDSEASPTEEKTPSTPPLEQLDRIKLEPQEEATPSWIQPSSSSRTPSLKATDFYTCPICDAGFTKEKDLMDHKCHPNEPSADECHLFTCPECKTSFALKDTLNFHMATFHKNSPSFELSKVKTENEQQLTLVVDPRQKIGSPAQSAQKIFITTKRLIDGDRCSDVPVKIRRTQLSSPRVEENMVGLSSARARVVHAGVSPESTLSLPSPMSSTLSPTSSASSRTLTASPESRQDEFPQGARHGLVQTPMTIAVRRGSPRMYGTLPDPPTPDHDYLGQIYKKKTVFFSRAPKPSPQSGVHLTVRPRRNPFDVHEIGSPTQEMLLKIKKMSNSASKPLLTRKQAKRVQRRQTLMKAARTP